MREIRGLRTSKFRKKNKKQTTKETRPYAPSSAVHISLLAIIKKKKKRTHTQWNKLRTCKLRDHLPFKKMIQKPPFLLSSCLSSFFYLLSLAFELKCPRWFALSSCSSSSSYPITLLSVLWRGVDDDDGFKCLAGRLISNSYLLTFSLSLSLHIHLSLLHIFNNSRGYVMTWLAEFSSSSSHCLHSHKKNENKKKQTLFYPSPIERIRCAKEWSSPYYHFLKLLFN